ncbi:MAG: sigma-70 family RNA polymerase sigma factor [Bacteroidota bacterium]
MQDPNAVERIRKGDGHALKRLYKSEFVRLYALAYRLTGDEEKAEAVVLTVMRQMWENKETLDVFQPLDLVLLREVYTTSRRVAPDIDPIESIKNNTPNTYPLVQALQKLDPKSRFIFLLHSTEGFSYREIAFILDVTEDTVTHYMSRALEGVAPALVGDVEAG